MQLGFYIDQTRCIGCHTCAVACKDWHDIPAGPVKLVRVTTIERGKYPRPFLAYLPVHCFHCENPACIAVCPVNAIGKREHDGVVIVDEDIDPSNSAEVIWAMATRCDPEKYIDILRDCWSSKSDPTIPPEKRERGNFTSSKVIVLACRPFYWINQFPETIKSSAEFLKKTEEKWGKALFGD